MEKQTFNIKGMMRDLSPSKTPNDFAYEIRNLRLTAQEDSTMLSLVSEKSNKQYTLKNFNGTADFAITGNIVGYCIVGTEYFTIFTHDATTGDYIYRLKEASNTTMLCKCLYGHDVNNHVKDLGFTDNTNIEAIGVYENLETQKVYWIDGVNQPRVINIVADNTSINKWDLMNICPFDFMLKMNLGEAVTIVNSETFFGMFAPGTIQYILSYRTSMGQTSPAFYMSPLWYITRNGKAVSPEGVGCNSFQITITKGTIDTSFDYVIIYSVQRTSENGTPICKKVAELRIEDFVGTDITYVDNGLSSETVDYSEILYLGGSNIIPYTMEQKTNTLFFGNIISTDFIISDEDIAAIREDTSLGWTRSTPMQIAETANTYYPYKGQLSYPANTITTFKFGESYYFGIIAQNEYGQWSNVIPLNTKRIQNEDLPPTVSQGNYYGVSLAVVLGNDALDILNGLGCKKLRVVRLDEVPQVACQGVLAPTIFNKKRVTEDGANYAQSSWYFRPIKSSDRDYIDDNKAQYYHNKNLRISTSKNCNEIQGSSTSMIQFSSSNVENLKDVDMFVDWNILTFHSPELEFDSNDYEGIEHIKIVGVVPVQYGITSMFMELASPPHSASGGFRPITITDSDYSTNNAPLCLSNWYFYDDKYFNREGTYQWYGTTYYTVFPWHRSHSFTSQLTPDEGDSWYSEPKSKCMASLRSSYMSHFIVGAYESMDNEYDIDITPFRMVNSNAVALPQDANCPDMNRVYFSEVDTVLFGEMTTYGKPTLESSSVFPVTTEDDFVRMSYKSSRHGVFSIKYGIGNIQRIMPNTAELPIHPSFNYEELESMSLPSVTETYDYLYLADLVRAPRAELYNFAGSRWLIAGTIHTVPVGMSHVIYGNIGDTYIQRYDCLKTFAYSPESQNQVVDIMSFMCETRVNIESRYDNRRGNPNNTVVNDTNFNLFNSAYNQLDNFYNPQYLNPDIKNITYLPNRVIWTGTKVYGSKVDKWTHVVSTSTLDMDGSYGSITSLKLWNDQLLCFQDRALARIQYNDRTAISTTAGVPIEIANSEKVDGKNYLSTNIGCSNKNSIAITQEGIYFIDSNTREIYRWTKGLESLSKAKGFNTYMQDIDLDTEKTFCDPKLKDVYFRINRKIGNSNITECLVFNELLGEFTSFFDYDMDFMFLLKDSLVSVEHSSHNLWKQFAGDSYLRYFNETSSGDPVYKTYSVHLVSADHPTMDKTFTGVEFRADAIDGDITHPNVQLSENIGYASSNTIPFKTLRVWNEYQDTGDVSFQTMLRKGTNLTQKFRIWRGQIGRDITHKLDRIRSPWARIELTGGGENLKTVIHDIDIMYV